MQIPLMFSSLIQTILSVPEFHRFGCQGSSRTIPSVGNLQSYFRCTTLPRRIPVHLYVTIVFTLGANVNCFWLFHCKTIDVNILILSAVSSPVYLTFCVNGHFAWIQISVGRQPCGFDHHFPSGINYHIINTLIS